MLLVFFSLPSSFCQHKLLAQESFSLGGMFIKVVCTVFFSSLFSILPIPFDRVLLLNPVAFLTQCTGKARDEWLALLHDAFHLNVMADERDGKKNSRENQTEHKRMHYKMKIVRSRTCFCIWFITIFGVLCWCASTHTTNQTHTLIGCKDFKRWRWKCVE